MLLHLAERRSWRRLLPWFLPLLVLPLAPSLLALFRVLDSGICAQLPTHMLRPGGIPLPLCARNTGIYSGAALTFGVLRAQGRQRSLLPPSPALIALLLALIGVMGIDGLNSVAADLGLPHPYPPSNALRLATGLAAGMALALLLSPVIARARFGLADRRPPLSSCAALWPCAAVTLGAYPVIVSAAAWTLYPVTLLSNAGLFAVLGGANIVAVSALRGLTAPARPPIRTGPPLPAIAVACFIELAALAVLKHSMVAAGVL